ncbi:putative DNA helicase [Dioscorea sansibarensis]
MLLPLPRLTSSLRAPFDVDQAYLHRKSILQSRQSKRSKDDLELARKLVPRWDEASSNVRQTYKQFLGALVELINGETSSDEFHEIAKTIYDLFTGPDTACGDISHKIVEKRGELQMLVGYSISDSTLQKVASLAQRLFSLQSTDDKTDLIQAKLADVGANYHEFGNNITFQSPARFLVETPLENGCPLATDSWTAPVSLHEDNDHQQVLSSHESSVSHGAVNLRWLKNVCDQIVEGGGSQLSGDELAMALCRVLQSNKAGDEIAGDLLDLVGDDAFEAVQDILSHRKDLVDAINHGMSMLKSEKMQSNTQPRMPSYGTQVTIQTESDRQIEKLRRKEEKRHKRGGDYGNMHDFSGESFSSLLAASERKQPLDDVMGTGHDSNSSLVSSLPQGTVRLYRKNYEEVRIPPTPTAPMRPDEKLIEIKELDDFAQAAFQGYKSLNRIQSCIFHTTYHSNANILVCAPTGAGKTNIAMISVLHEIKQHFRDGILHKNEFKIVYVAPMKALAAEVTSTFSHRLSPLNLTVRELTGDMQLSKNELEETQMIVTTPEKWDVITRKSSDMSLSMLVKLLIIDEVHLLNDDRGSVIEALVARTLRQVESSQSMIRIVGLSATLPNYLEVAQFLRVNPETGLFFFDSSYRPVPLAQQYIGISEKDYAKRINLYNTICYEKVLDALKQGHQAMVFVHSRKDTGKTARILVKCNC